MVKSSLRGSGAAKAEARKGRRRERKCRVDGSMMGNERVKGVNGGNGGKELFERRRGSLSALKERNCLGLRLKSREKDALAPADQQV